MPITPQDIDNALKLLGEPKAKTLDRIGDALDPLNALKTAIPIGQVPPAKPPLAHPSETISASIPVCCQKPMHKAGFAWSGHNKRQAWRCGVCGRRTIRTRIVFL